MTIGKRIKARRKQIGMSAETLAAKVGVSPVTIYRYESGDIEKVDSIKLEQIAEALGVSPGYLMGWETDSIEKKLHDIGQQLTSSTDYALHDVMRSLSEGARQDVLEFALFRRAQEEKEKARHDD